MSDRPDTFGLGKVVIMDGGMGSTLEDDYNQKIKGKPLWSAEVLRDAPDVILDVHLAFVKAGAAIIKTATYQCGPLSFKNAGLDAAMARDLMHQAVRLADEARTKSGRPVHVALSLGPYGAQIGQEYSGYYPPPYGPEGPDSNGVAQSNAFRVTDLEKEEEAKEALIRFHYERLLVFASDPSIWSMIDYLAFETIPLLREAQAIQKAVSMLGDYLSRRAQGMKPWWLSFVFFNRQFPQDSRPGGRKISVSELVRGLCSSTEFGKLPDGIGVNCTVPDDAIQTVKSLAHEITKRSTSQPWLVLYPNGGHGYDITSHSWNNRGGFESGEVARNKWVEGIGEFCRVAQAHSRGILVGGCCKCGPTYVQALRQFLTSANAETEIESTESHKTTL